MNENSSPQHRLHFLSVSSRQILDEIASNTPSLLLLSYLQTYHSSMWKNGGGDVIAKLNEIAYEYLFTLGVQVADELRNLKTKNYEQVVQHVYQLSLDSRKNIKMPLFTSNFFRKLFSNCAYQQEKRSMSPNVHAQQTLTVSPTIPQDQCGVQPTMNTTAIKPSDSALHDKFSEISQSTGSPQTSLCLVPQPITSVWQLNGTNESLVYQSQQPMPTIPVQLTPQLQLIPKTPIAQPLYQTQLGECQQPSAAMSWVVQNVAHASQQTTTNPCDGYANSLWNSSVTHAPSQISTVDARRNSASTVQVQANFNSDRKVESSKYIPGIASLLNQAMPTPINTSCANTNSNSVPSSIKEASNRTISSAILPQSIPNHNHSHSSASARVPGNAKNSNRSSSVRKRSAFVVQDAKPAEGMPSKKFAHQITPRKIFPKIDNISNSVPPTTERAPLQRIQATRNEISDVAAEVATQSRSRKLKIGTNDDADKNIREQKRIIEFSSESGTDSGDFEILVQTSTDIRGNTETAKTDEAEEIDNSPPEKYKKDIVDLCEDCNSRYSDVEIVETQCEPSFESMIDVSRSHFFRFMHLIFVFRLATLLEPHSHRTQISNILSFSKHIFFHELYLAR